MDHEERVVLADSLQKQEGRSGNLRGQFKRRER
jgi:hypothetical protein